MTAQEKAQEIFDKMWLYQNSIDEDDEEYEKAMIYFTRESAKILCDEFIKYFDGAHEIKAEFGAIQYFWTAVKECIDNINKASTE